jgi:hypothetical protein
MSSISQASAPGRRWLSFSLKTMLVVVTAFAVWLGWELKSIRDRKAMLEWINDNGFACTATEASPDLPPDKRLFDPSPRRVTIPFWRRWLGDEAIAYIGIGKKAPDSATWKTVARLFPEAYWWNEQALEWLPFSNLEEEVIPVEPIPFAVIGKIPVKDAREIWRVVKDYCKENNIKGETLSLEVIKNGDVEVTLGEERGPLDGGGIILEMRNTSGAWVVLSRSPWVSRAETGANIDELADSKD